VNRETVMIARLELRKIGENW